jgi:hypothetical protein
VSGRKKVPYPEVRPGVKVCAVCGAEFHYPENPIRQTPSNWPARRFCTARCSAVAKARRERARWRAKGVIDPYRKTPRTEKKPEPTFDMRHSHQPRQMDALKALPPEAKTSSIKEAFQRAVEAHEEFLPILINVTKERRGFKTRVRNHIKATRREASARS